MYIYVYSKAFFSRRFVCRKRLLFLITVFYIGGLHRKSEIGEPPNISRTLPTAQYSLECGPYACTDIPSNIYRNHVLPYAHVKVVFFAECCKHPCTLQTPTKLKICDIFWPSVLRFFASNMHARRPKYVTFFGTCYMFRPSVCLLNAAAQDSEANTLRSEIATQFALLKHHTTVLKRHLALL